MVLICISLRIHKRGNFARLLANFSRIPGDWTRSRSHLHIVHRTRRESLIAEAK